jgi:hypothetical protein
MTSLTPTEFAALAVAWLLAASRTMQATKAAWGVIPPKWQWVPATALTLVTELSVKLAVGVHSWMDVMLPTMLVLSTMLPGVRSNVHAALDGLATRLAKAPEVAELSENGLQRLTRGAATPSTAAMLVGSALFALVLLPSCGAAPKLDPSQRVKLELTALNVSKLGVQRACGTCLQDSRCQPDVVAICMDLLEQRCSPGDGSDGIGGAPATDGGAPE